MSRTHFRLLIALYLVLIVADIVATFLGPRSYSPELAAVLEKEADPSLTENMWLMLGVVLPLLVAGITGGVGLLMFKRWGRTLSLVSTAATLLVNPLLDDGYYYTWLETGILEASALLWGAILALAYYSPVSAQFGDGSADR